LIGNGETFMVNITVDEFQRDPLKYLRQVEAGETFAIIESDKPIAELRPIAPSNKQLRPFGLCTGEFTVPDDFDASLPEEILSAFEGK
jgi:antitoxin (DNA-binding transcriptional repressor) of toxin-antitoxin stability system